MINFLKSRSDIHLKHPYTFPWLVPTMNLIGMDGSNSIQLTLSAWSPEPCSGSITRVSSGLERDRISHHLTIPSPEPGTSSFIKIDKGHIIATERFSKEVRKSEKNDIFLIITFLK